MTGRNGWTARRRQNGISQASRPQDEFYFEEDLSSVKPLLRTPYITNSSETGDVMSWGLASTSNDRSRRLLWTSSDDVSALHVEVVVRCLKETRKALMQQFQLAPRLVRHFSLRNSVQARVLQIPLFGASGKIPPPPQSPQEEKMSGPLNGEITIAMHSTRL